MKTLMMIALAIAMTAPVMAQAASKPVTEKSLFWFSAEPAVEIVLIDRAEGFNLIVISDRDVKVTYRTSINSMESVIKTLEPLQSKAPQKYFLVRHSFSKRTIWMALDFTVDGKPVPALTRTFYDGLLEIVPNEQFKDDAPK